MATTTYYYTSSTTGGYLFSYGSSATTHSRYLQTKTTYGRVNQVYVQAYAPPPVSYTTNSGWYNNLNPLRTGDDLELWYSTANPAPQPPTAGQSPSVLGWTKHSTLWYGGSSILTYADSQPGLFSRRVNITSTSTQHMTWLVWQKNFQSQTTSESQRLNEYNIKNIEIASSWYLSSIATTKQNQSSTMPRVSAELTSGSIIRISAPADRSGNTVLVDYVVSSNPADRGPIAENMYLQLRSATSTPITGYINEYSAGYFQGLNAAAADIVETRTIASVNSETSFTVVGAWSSNSIRGWADGSGTAKTARPFSIAIVPSSALVALSTPWSRPASTLSPVTASTSGVTAVADRRFSVVFINNDTDIQVSGGAIHASFAGKSATFAKLETAPFLISGYHDGSNLTSNTTWNTIGLPGYSSDGFYGNPYREQTTIKFGGHTTGYTIVSVLSDTAVLVTGATISTNMFDTSMVSYFPGPSEESVMVGTGTLFAQSTTSFLVGSTTSIVSTEELTVYDGTDRRIGFIRDDAGQTFRILAIYNNSSIAVSHSVPIIAPVSGSGANAYKRTREYGANNERALARPGTATFDRTGANVTADESLIVQGNNVDFTKYRELFNSTGALVYAESDVILQTSITVQATNDLNATSTLSSYLLLITWMKDMTENAGNELSNHLTVVVDPNVSSIFTVFDDSAELQRNSKDIALGRTLMYADTFYVQSSSWTVETGLSQQIRQWNPENENRAGTYSRLAIRFGGVYTTSSATTAEVVIAILPGLGFQNYLWESTSSDFLNITVIGAD